MSDEQTYVYLTASEGGSIFMSIPESDGDRNMTESEIALLAFYVRVHKDPEWGLELIEWFETNHGDQLGMTDEAAE